ncbi:helix-turn-helix transcriptional regulator [Haloprofundus salinisoli]|uniref:helix-turn-helix transcriptional regulator n=1 Tax=Haloprofundus salinisoli TaxID=2876193 RepID=UPI001CCFC5DC|nr:helix-turn-helix domain-containing protein [Haloprofundus salinisoli]
MRYAALVLAFLVFSAGFAPPAAAVVDSDDGQRATLLQAEEPPDTELVIAIKRNGDARWSVITRYPLSDNTSSAAFEQFVSDLRAGEANATLDERTFEQFAALSSEATGREMEIRNVSYRGTVENDTGVLNMTFTWTKFAYRGDQDLRVGDAFETPDGGTWFPRLEADQRLIIEAPDGWNSQDVSFPARTRDGTTVIVDGPREFTDRSGDGSVIDISYDSPGSGRLTPGGDGSGDLTLIAGVGAVLVFAAMLAAVVLRRRQGFEEVDGEVVTVDGPTTTPPPRATGGGASVADPPSEEPEEDDDVDLSLLSDGERVEHLLERNGGRMRQTNIVAETGWSDAKVSQLLSSLAEEGRVEKLRLGRENLISLPGEHGNGNGDGEN